MVTLFALRMFDIRKVSLLVSLLQAADAECMFILQ